MDQPATITTEQAKELLDAQAHIWNHIFSFLNSMALKCAVELDIPDVIQKHGKPMTLTELTNALDIHPTKAPSLHRLLRLLCHSNFFSIKKLPNQEDNIGLTITSQLLLKNHPLTQAPFVLALLNPIMTESAHEFGSWFKNDQETPFHITHGMSFWEHTGQVAKFNELFNHAMASDAQFVITSLLASSNNNNKWRGLLEGIESLVDVGGGNGTFAKAIAKAFPRLKCMVLDLPHVVEGLQNNDEHNLIYIGGDMFEAIPSANAVLLKWIMHDWSDEKCVKILRRCKSAIPSKDKGGKVIIIDMVVKNQSDVVEHLDTQILFDMEMMSLTIGGKERTEDQWKRLFIDAGFSDYKIYPLLGLRSVIVVYPL